MNPPQAPKLVNEKAKRDGRLLKIVLDGKRPITEAGDPTERVPDNVAEMMVVRRAIAVKQRSPGAVWPPGGSPIEFTHTVVWALGDGDRVRPQAPPVSVSLPAPRFQLR